MPRPDRLQLQSAATDSDDSCTYVDGICQTCENGIIVDNDTDGDGVCDADEIAGCQDATACNYNAAATDSDDSCTYVDGICQTCENGVIVDNDTDGDGVCNADEIAGCQDATACNYNAAATDSDDSCTYVDGICQTCENGLIVDNDTDGDGVCNADEIAGCQDANRLQLQCCRHRLRRLLHLRRRHLPDVRERHHRRQ